MYNIAYSLLCSSYVIRMGKPHFCLLMRLDIQTLWSFFWPVIITLWTPKMMWVYCLYHLLCARLIYIYKEELKTVVCDLFACTQPNRHETSTALWNPYRRVSLRGRRAQIRFSWGARGEKPEKDRPPFWLYGESIRTSVHGSHNVVVEAPSLECHRAYFIFLRGAIAVEAPRRRAASARLQ